MNICCVFNRTPRIVRIVLGIGFLIVGLPIFILPIPLGIFLISIGVFLLAGASGSFQGLIKERSENGSRLFRTIRPLMDQCKNCLK